MNDGIGNTKEAILYKARPGQILSLASGAYITTDRGEMVSLTDGKTIRKAAVDLDDFRGWTINARTYFENKLENDSEYKKRFLLQFCMEVEGEVEYYSLSGDYDDYEELPELLRSAVKEFVK